MKKNSQFGEANVAGPFEFLIDGIQVKFFPHFDLIDCIGWDIIESSSPIISLVPLVSLLLSPS